MSLRLSDTTIRYIELLCLIVFISSLGLLAHVQYMLYTIDIAPDFYEFKRDTIPIGSTGTDKDIDFN